MEEEEETEEEETEEEEEEDRHHYQTRIHQRRMNDEEQSVSDQKTRRTRGISLLILPWDFLKGGSQEDEEQLAAWSCP